MRKLALVCAMAAVAACSQREGPAETGVVSEVCGNLQDDIKQLQFGAASSVAELTSEVVANGDDPASYDRRKEIEDRFEIRLNNVLVLMGGHNCKMPDTVPNPYAFLTQATECQTARDANAENARELCTAQSWTSEAEVD